MILKEMKIIDYLDILKTDAPAPGGGGVAGLTAAQGIALTLMVLELTLGRDKYKEYEENNLKVYEKSKDIYRQLCDAADRDKEAFIQLSEAYKLPRNTEEEKIERKKIIGEKSIGATQSPYEVIELCYEAAVETEKLLGKSNQMASSDLGVAAANFVAASKSAWLNVKINLPYITDEERKEFYEKESKELLIKIEEISDRIYKYVEENL